MKLFVCEGRTFIGNEVTTSSQDQMPSINPTVLSEAQISEILIAVKYRCDNCLKELNDATIAHRVMEIEKTVDDNGLETPVCVVYIASDNRIRHFSMRAYDAMQALITRLENIRSNYHSMLVGDFFEVLNLDSMEAVQLSKAIGDFPESTVSVSAFIDMAVESISRQCL